MVVDEAVIEKYVEARAHGFMSASTAYKMYINPNAKHPAQRAKSFEDKINVKHLLESKVEINQLKLELDTLKLHVLVKSLKTTKMIINKKDGDLKSKIEAIKLASKIIDRIPENQSNSMLYEPKKIDRAGVGIIN